MNLTATRNRARLIPLAMLATTLLVPAWIPDAQAERRPRPVATADFAPAVDDTPPAQPLNGVLRFDGNPRGSRSGSLKVHADTFELARDRTLDIDRLPDFSITWVSDGETLIPAERLPQVTNHPFWSFIAGPGRAWTPGGEPGTTRIGFPFTLKEKLQNCVHNGLATLTLPVDGGEAIMDWQISAQTCAYLKFELAGRARVTWTPTPAADHDTVIAQYRDEVARRLPVQPMSALADQWPEIDIEALAPASRDDLSVYGLVVDGIHYRGGCNTAHGPHPYCDDWVLPSYSTAKSLFAGLGYLHLLSRYPDLARATVTQWVPECRLEDDRWEGVTLEHLLDMSTGNYTRIESQADEFSTPTSAFFVMLKNADRTRLACQAWPRQAEPGTVAVYHSTDHYLLGVALARFLAAKSGTGAELYRDVMVNGVLGPLQPGPLLAYTDRTVDADRQPFTAYGLLYQPDDVARMGNTLPRILRDPEQFPAGLYNEVLFQNISSSKKWPDGQGERYRFGWWGFDAGDFLGCESPAWIPFMTGYGGIVWALLPNGMTYYRFTDGTHQPWRNAVAAAHSIRPVCD